MTETDADWGFQDAADARAYLRELARLWTLWIAGVIALILVNNLAVLLAGVAVIGGLLWFARPLQARAAAVVPQDTLVGSRWTVVGKGTARDQVLRKFAYGEEPLRQAVTMAGASPLWLAMRRIVVLGTVVAFVYVLYTWFQEP